VQAETVFGAGASVFGSQSVPPPQEEHGVNGPRLTRRQLVAAGAGAVVAATGASGLVGLETTALAQDDDRGILIMKGSGSTLPANYNPLLGDVRVWLYDGLVRFDENVNPIPDLAESWEISPDGLVYTLKLRQDVKFHDGQPMTADDVIYTAQLTLDETINSPYRDKFHQWNAGHLGKGR